MEGSLIISSECVSSNLDTPYPLPCWQRLFFFRCRKMPWPSGASEAKFFACEYPLSLKDPPIVRYLKSWSYLHWVKMSLNFSIVSVDGDMIQIFQLYANRFLTLKLKKKAIWRLPWVVNSLFTKTYLSLSKIASTIPIIAVLKVCTWIFWLWSHSISAKKSSMKPKFRKGPYVLWHQNVSWGEHKR